MAQQSAIYTEVTVSTSAGHVHLGHVESKAGGNDAAEADRCLSPADLACAPWRKSSWSAYNGSCVEVAPLAGAVAVRDTKAQGRGPVLMFGPHAWTAFLLEIKSGQHAL